VSRATCGFVRPRTLDEAFQAREAHPDWTVVAGGTDLMVGVIHRPAPAGVIDVFNLPGLRGISETGEQGIRIGAGTTYADLLRSEVVRDRLPLLHECAREVGAVQIQERGTLGGNVATSSPVGDTLPALLALNAVVELGSSQGTRHVPYAEYCTGYRQTQLLPHELIVALVFPAPPAGLVQFWRKVGTRKAQSISKVMVAASALVTDGALSRVRLAMGAVAATPIRLTKTEALLEG
jgi:xanthine dehydrogenase small subunit